MIIDKTRAATRSVPQLYNVLSLGLAVFRGARRRVRALTTKRAIGRFRRWCKNLPTLVSQPVFVKVGANDGTTGDPCSDILLADARWKGLLIEPVPYCFDRLRDTFHDSQRFSLEQVAVGAIAGQATFYYVDQAARDSVPELPAWFDQVGSFDREHIVKTLNGILQPFIVECTVEVCRLSNLFDRNGIREVHLLHIDAEGHDYVILKTVDLRTRAPVSIFVEHKCLPGSQKTEMVRLLHEHGYSVDDCGDDYFALHKSAGMSLRRGS